MYGSRMTARKKVLKRMLRLSSSASQRPSPNLMTLATNGVEERVEERQPGDRVAPQELVVLEADPLARPADLGVGEAEPEAQAERIGQEQQQQHRRGQHEEQPERVAVVLQSFEKGHRRTGKDDGSRMRAEPS